MKTELKGLREITVFSKEVNPELKKRNVLVAINTR